MRARLVSFPLVIVLLALALSVALYPSLPERFAVHWNAQGEPDGYGGPGFAFLMPLIMLGAHLLLCVLPKTSPKGFELGASEGVYRIVQNAILLFLLCVHGFIVGSAANLIDSSPRMFAHVGVGALLALIGNYLGKVRRNFFLGIRTPWTLADDEVWLRTHRLGGKLLTVAGLAILALALVPSAPEDSLIGIILVAVLVPAAYSFVLYRKLHPR